MGHVPSIWSMTERTLHLSCMPQTCLIWWGACPKCKLHGDMRHGAYLGSHTSRQPMRHKGQTWTNTDPILNWSVFCILGTTFSQDFPKEATFVCREQLRNEMLCENTMNGVYTIYTLQIMLDIDKYVIYNFQTNFVPSSGYYQESFMKIK